MGGIGSGHYCRTGTKTTIEETKRIDVRFMHRQGMLKPGYQGSLSWTSRGEPSGNINYICHQESLFLDYRYRVNGGDWQPVQQQISIVTTPCNYGGGRKWFLCPSCSRRVAILCSGGKLFLCRHCYRLPYNSQQQGYIDRLIAKKHRIGRLIFEGYDGDGWRKKKWLHRKTFDRLWSDYNLLDSEIDSIIERHLLL